MCLHLLSLCFTLLVLSISVKTFNAMRAQVDDVFGTFSGKISSKTIIFTPVSSPDWLWARPYLQVTQIWRCHCCLKLDLHLSMTHVVHLSYSEADSLLPGLTGKPLKPPHSHLCVYVCVYVCVFAKKLFWIEGSIFPSLIVILWLHWPFFIHRDQSITKWNDL